MINTRKVAHPLSFLTRSGSNRGGKGKRTDGYTIDMTGHRRKEIDKNFSPTQAVVFGARYKKCTGQDRYGDSDIQFFRALIMKLVIMVIGAIWRL